MRKLLLFVLIGFNLFSSYEIRTGKVHYIPEPFEDNEVILEGIDLSSFKIFYNYAKDKNNVYYKGFIIVGADAKSFKEVSFDYAKDKNFVYYGSMILDKADSKTFKVLNNSCFAKDKKNIYFLNEILENVDFNTFKVLDESYSRDKNTVYTYSCDGPDHKYSGYNKLKEADVNNFKVLSFKYAKDKNNVYYMGQKLEKADAKTFKAAEKNYDAEDKNSYYKDGEAIKNRK